MQRYTVFDSALGPIGLVWTERGVVSLLLPERTRRATEAELRARHPSAELAEPSVPIRRAVDKIQKLLRGEKVSLASVPVDLSGVSEFYCSVYELARQIPHGETRSYGEIARALGKLGAARAVGQALGRNPVAIVVPCHRVLASGGGIGGFSAPGGTATKTRLLAIEQGALGATSAKAAPRSSANQAKPAPAKAAAAKTSLSKARVVHERRRETTRQALHEDFDEGSRYLHSLEPKFRSVIERAGPMRLGRGQTDVFLALAKAITYQQLSGKAAGSIWARVLELDGKKLRPDFVAEAQLSLLRGAGLSEAKARSLQDLAQRVVAGEIPKRRALLGMTDEEIIERLTVVRGVGRWTVEMFLIFDLGRPDVLSSTDYGVRKGYSLIFGTSDLPTPRELERHGERWAPHRSTATWYFWRALEQVD